jgi:hypothetical protein
LGLLILGVLPGLEFGALGAALCHFLLPLFEALDLLGRQDGADIFLALVLVSLEVLLHGLLLGGRQLVQVALMDVMALLHLLAHNLADLAALILAQVQVMKRFCAMVTVVLAVFRTLLRFLVGHGQGHGGQNGGDQQGGQSLAHDNFLVSIPGVFRMWPV